MPATTTIAFFDSGVGGISVWRAVRQRLPGCPTLYVADNAHLPYGPRPAAQIRRYSAAITRFLLAQGAGLVVVACNTASAAALQWLRGRFDVPFVGMEPAVKPAAEATRTGHVGVLATRGTVDGELFRNTSARYANGVAVHVQVGDGLVECVETGQADSAETEQVLRRYIDPMLQAGVDRIVLGCTHYAFLLPMLERILPATVTVVDAAEAVARQVEWRVVEMPQAATSTAMEVPVDHRFFTTGTPAVMAALLRGELSCEPHVERLAWRRNRLETAAGAPAGA
jgi:glutamate racemase